MQKLKTRKTMTIMHSGDKKRKGAGYGLSYVIQDNLNSQKKGALVCYQRNNISRP